MLRRAAVIGGAGAVGGMFVELLAAAGAEVAVLDRAQPRTPLPAGATSAPYDVERDDGAPLAQADVVVLALPEPVAQSAVTRVVDAMDPGALLVHTMSVQSRLCARLSTPQPVEVVGVNPLFAPSLGIEGRGVATVVVHGGPRTEALLALLSSAGGRIVRLGWDEHDRAMAGAQVLTHAAVLSFGIALRDLGVDIAVLGACAPPPHRALLALLARIAGGTPEVYWDIQEANPFAQEARAALRAGVDELADVAGRGPAGEQHFAALLATLAAQFGDDLAAQRRVSDVLLGGLRE